MNLSLLTLCVRVVKTNIDIFGKRLYGLVSWTIPYHKYLVVSFHIALNKKSNINIDSVSSLRFEKTSIFYCPLIRFFPGSFSRKNVHNTMSLYMGRAKSSTSRQSCPAPVLLIKMSRLRNL